MNTMLLALQITALGMGLVFAAIILLWWMMSLLTAFTTDNKPASAPAESPSGLIQVSVLDRDLKAQAAAVAVATAMAELHATLTHDLREPSATIVSAWQLGMRTRQMYQKGGSFRRRAKQDDK
jgi:Na+-transporting methylmalonyl-CoA/oxaloacetate decarboxylase gamma subunit